MSALAHEPEAVPAVACHDCGRERTPQDHDFTPFQFPMGQPVGWISGDDGEFCGKCLTAMMRGQVP